MATRTVPPPTGTRLTREPRRPSLGVGANTQPLGKPKMPRPAVAVARPGTKQAPGGVAVATAQPPKTKVAPAGRPVGTTK